MARVYKKDVTVPGGSFNAIEDRVMQSSAISNSKYAKNNNFMIFDSDSKLRVTSSSTDFTIGIGKAILCGCLFDNDVVTTLIPSRPTSSTAKAYLCLTIDVNGTTGQKQFFEDVLGDVSNFPILQKDDLTEVTGIKNQVALASYTIDSNGFITNFVDMTTNFVGEGSDALPITGGEVTGALTIPNTTKVRGHNTGNANNSYIQFMESNNTVRRGYVGDSENSANISLGSDIGNVMLAPANGYIATVKDNEIWHAGNAGIIINDTIIGYDDTIHTTTPLQDILKDLFEKSESFIGSDKPFILTFLINDNTYGANLWRACNDLIAEKYGSPLPIGSKSYCTFKIEVTTENGTSYGYMQANKVSIESDNFNFSWFFDYDNWVNVIVYDREGFVWDKNKPVTLAENILCDRDSCSFSDNAWLYDWIVATSGSQELSDVVIWIKVVGDVTSNLGGNYTRAMTSSVSPSVQIFYIGGTLDNSGTLFSKPSGASSLGGIVTVHDNTVPHTSDSGVTFTFYGIGKRSTSSRTAFLRGEIKAGSYSFNNISN